MAQAIRFKITADSSELLEEKKMRVLADLRVVGAHARVEHRTLPNKRTRSYCHYIIVSRGKNDKWDPIKAVVESYTSRYTWTDKEAAIAGSGYGAYIRTYELPDRDVFRFRWRALKRHDGFKEFCNRPDIDELEESALGVGHETEEWFARGEYFKVCLAIFGNVHKLSFWHAWGQYQFAFATWQMIKAYTKNKGNRLVPFFEITPGTPAPEGRLNISIDPSLRRKDISRFFEKFITERRKHIARTAETDPHHGYFSVTEKRVDVGVMKRYLAVWDLKQKYPQTWHLKAPKRFPEEYTGNRERNREKAYKDLARAKNIIEWAIRGRFPCTKPIK